MISIFYRAKDCDIIVLVLDASKQIHSNQLLLPEYIEQIVRNRSSQDMIIVMNKIDLLSVSQLRLLDAKLDYISKQWPQMKLRLSCVKKQGLDQLYEELKGCIEFCCGDPDSESCFSDARHMAHLEEIVRQLELTLGTIDYDLAIAASHLRQAAYQLSCLTGSITTEDVLDVIFKDFCIGK